MSANWVRGTYNGSKTDLNSSRPVRQHFDIGISNRPGSAVRLTPASAREVNQFVRNLGGDEAAPPDATSGLGDCECRGNRTGDLGDGGESESDSSSSYSVDVSDSTTVVPDSDLSQVTDSNGNVDASKLKSYLAKKGVDAASNMGVVKDIIRRISVTVQKVQNVYNDAEKGAEYGSVIPGYGTAVGTAIGAAYGVADQFGDDIKSAFSGGPRWSEDEYAEMRVKCTGSGGNSVPGRAPNNLDSCRYPDGSLSGGDNPAWDAGAKAAYEADLEARKINLAGLGSYIAGLKEIDKLIAKADMAVRKAANPSDGLKARNAWMKQIGAAFGKIYNATKPEGAAPANVSGFLSDISPRVFTPSLHMQILKGDLSNAIHRAQVSNTRAAINKLTPASLQKLGTALRSARIPPAIAATVGKAIDGDKASAIAVRDTVDAARAGDAGAINNARLMSHAQRLILLHSFVLLYNGGA